MSAIDQLLDPIPIPRVVPVNQFFEPAHVASPEEETVAELDRSGVLEPLRQGQSVAIAVGSRGVADLALIVRGVVKAVEQAGAHPFVVPAMGSHGGATPEGQQGVLERMGVTEKTIGAPIRATMETTVVGTSEGGLPVHLDKYAHEADATIIINRIHPHVAFRGPYESGLMKMLAIGLGKLEGANICHDLGFGAMNQNILDIGKKCLEASNILCGLAVLENGYHQVYRVQAVKADEIPAVEPGLLELAKELEPCIYFDDLDVLIMEEIGKNIAGSGFDTNIIGRFATPFISGGPNITKMSILDVTDVSHGNCMGVGLADFTTRRLFDKFDFEQTYPNSLTATVQPGIKIPMVMKNDRQAIQAAIKTCNIADKTSVRLVWVKNTLEIQTIRISESLLKEAQAHPKLKVIGGPEDIPFDADGNLTTRQSR